MTKDALTRSMGRQLLRAARDIDAVRKQHPGREMLVNRVFFARLFRSYGFPGKRKDTEDNYVYAPYEARRFSVALLKGAMCTGWPDSALDSVMSCLRPMREHSLRIRAAFGLCHMAHHSSHLVPAIGELERGALLIAEFAGEPVFQMQPARFNCGTCWDVGNDCDHLRLIDEIARLALTYIPAGDCAAHHRLQAVGKAFREFGFRGTESADFYDEANSYLPYVLGNRVGIPVTLGVVFIAVARRLGLRASGTDMPGYFLVHVSLDNEDSGSLEYKDRGDPHGKPKLEKKVAFVDAFKGGRVLELHECRELLHQAGKGSEMCLQPVPDAAVWRRMCTNLLFAQWRIRNTEAGEWWATLLKDLQVAMNSRPETDS